MTTDPGDDAGADGQDRPPRRTDPEVAFPLSIVSMVFGLVGLTMPLLAAAAILLAVIAFLLNARHAPTRTFAIIGGVLGIVGAAASLVG
ncbi:hypothetical protein [Demequina pelophila]|uniref:hypothetical protein n=1 Tax=Demequina pelophila TaxID=1638984 RepID=UPI000784B21E|nr:hypothetical protein [Demequina pelophila]